MTIKDEIMNLVVKAYKVQLLQINLKLPPNHEKKKNVYKQVAHLQ